MDEKAQRLRAPRRLSRQKPVCRIGAEAAAEAGVPATRAGRAMPAWARDRYCRYPSARSFFSCSGSRRLPSGDSGLVAASIALAQAPADFTNDIRPIMERSCWNCHGEAVQLSSLGRHG